MQKLFKAINNWQFLKAIITNSWKCSDTETVSSNNLLGNQFRQAYVTEFIIFQTCNLVDKHKNKQNRISFIPDRLIF